VSDTGDLLRAVPYFAELPDELLEEVSRGSTEIEVAKGEAIIREGEEAHTAYVVVEGELEVTKLSEGRQVVLTRVGPGEVQGEMALLEESLRSATVTAATPARLLEIPAGSFRSLLDDPTFVLSILKTVIRRLRTTEAALRHEERMAALGKMAAQLMHELNNPAASLGRSVTALGEVHEKLGAVVIGLSDSNTDHIPEPKTGPPVSAVERANRENEVGSWLEAHSVREAWRLATALVEDGWGVSDLDALSTGEDPAVATLVEWIGLRCLAGQLIDEIRLGASRISELVRVVKGYSYLDQAPIQEIDIRSGIDDTLVLMRHKLDGVSVVTDYSDDLPRIEAPGRDLNQVWTNLIDNAADAMEGDGELRITARPVENGVEVAVANTGQAIPSDVLPRIFDPFFTTKEPGKGTGLGLHTVHTIVNRVGGDIEVESADGETRFVVTLPLQPRS
jgi:signal transduction histidine kinase